ncbi:kinase-like protein [Hygrophoropsis aurantiaca]|uniref:Kinase-like protein n=1 Tax=Hygrophoropsis aurantiaca TaxID=72124 RepID=A0ACB8AR37_9AGAM|nr:kinase-like protein [Hygrophoropsis aurantiaca]
MLAETPVDLTFDDEDWLSPPPLLYRSASVGNSWGVTSIGRGFDWGSKKEEPQMAAACEYTPEQKLDSISLDHPKTERSSPVPATRPSVLVSPLAVSPTPTSPAKFTSSQLTESPSTSHFTDSPISISPARSRTHTPLTTLRSLTPLQSNASESVRPPLSRSPSSARSRRRSSQQRVSLVAGRVLIAPIEPPSPPPVMPQILRRTSSSGNFLSSAASTAPPTPAPERASFINDRNISDFLIEGEIGRGAYGLVKRAREYRPDGSMGPPLILKQVIKSRILADCWKRHPQHGTIPIEIFVMSVISSTSYTLPPIRPWDPNRLQKLSGGSSLFVDSSDEEDGRVWKEGKVIKGHPNICPLLDYFEDSHYYYLVLPSSTPERDADSLPHPTDLFDLVESFPEGLPPNSVRSYLGQIADALSFLHLQGIVHRDVKDENVVLGPDGRCILIDFGSSGLLKKNGWDTFSGTLDYAGPEILRGERYYGKEQDVWAFGVVAYVLLVGECPFLTAAEAQEGLDSPFANASIALDERCGDDREKVGIEADGGGALGDAAALVKACLQVDVDARPTFDSILQCRFLSGGNGWGMDVPYGNTLPTSPQPSAFPTRVT